MTRRPVFGMADCWGCGAPTVPHKGSPFTAGCPGCAPDVKPMEKASDVDTQDLLYPDVTKQFRSMDEALIEETMARWRRNK